MEAFKDAEPLRSRLAGFVEPCVKAVVMFGDEASAGCADKPYR
jgi:hypothetical protein